MPSYKTKIEIDKAVERLLKEAGLRQPPIQIEALLGHLEVHRDFYSLEDPTLLKKFWHKVKVHKQKLFKIVEIIRLAAVWLPDEQRILVDSSLPLIKQKWASFHDATHTILEWHRPFFLGDTAQTLDPDFQEMLETEANYGASGLMFGGKLFTREALDTTPGWASIGPLTKRYASSLVATLRRYVQFSHNLSMALMVSTPRWMPTPEDQALPWRHFVCSQQFKHRFSRISPQEILEEINKKTFRRKGGPVGDFGLVLKDNNGILHEFHAESFFNQHYILTLIIYKKPLSAKHLQIA